MPKTKEIKEIKEIKFQILREGLLLDWEMLLIIRNNKDYHVFLISWINTGSLITHFSDKETEDLMFGFSKFS